MANILTLHQRQVFLETGSSAAYAQLYAYESGTQTQVTLYAEDPATPGASVLSQPVEADADGVFPPIFVADASLLRLLVTDEDDVPLQGYPMDDILPMATSGTGADGISFSPTETVTATTVQAAIEMVSELYDDQGDLNTRALTPWVTGGTGNAYTISPTPAITAYGGNTFIVRPDRANTSTQPTLNVNGLGTRPLRKVASNGSPGNLLLGELQPYREIMVYDDGEYFLIMFGRNFPVSDTNADGRFTKFPGGLMTCSKTLTGKGPISTADGSNFRSDAIDLGSWAAEFAETPLVFVTSQNAAASSWIGMRTAPTTTTAGQAFMYRSTTSNLTDYQVQVVGIGRWF
jgi:hypothetical protein